MSTTRQLQTDQDTFDIYAAIKKIAANHEFITQTNHRTLAKLFDITATNDGDPGLYLICVAEEIQSAADIWREDCAYAESLEEYLDAWQRAGLSSVPAARNAFANAQRS